MSLIKTAVKFLVKRFLTKEDLLPDLLAQQTLGENADLAISFFKKEAPLLSPGSRGYNAVVEAATALLLTHYRAGSFLQLCRSQVRKNSSPEYYAVAAMGKIISDHNVDTDAGPATAGVVSGGEAGQLLASIATALAEAKSEGNFIKRRSIVRKAIVSQLPGLSSDRAAQLTELALHVG